MMPRVAYTVGAVPASEESSTLPLIHEGARVKPAAKLKKDRTPMHLVDAARFVVEGTTKRGIVGALGGQRRVPP